MRVRTILLAVAAVGASFAAALGAMHWLSPRPLADRPALAAVPPLPPITGASVIIAPVAVALSAIHEAIEREAPHQVTGRRDNPAPQILSNAEIAWTATRGPLVLSARANTLTAASVIAGSARATGHLSQRAAGGVGSAISGFLGAEAGRAVERLAGRSFDQRADIRGNVALTVRPVVTEAWRLEPNLAAQVAVADAVLPIAGMRLNLANEVRPVVERQVNEQIAAAEARLRDDPFLERVGRREWAKLCRSIPLGTAPGAPNLWLEVKPVHAFAAQPRIDANAVILTMGVQAETRVVPAETKPDCPFPQTLRMLSPDQDARVSVTVPINVPLAEINRLIDAKLAGTTIPADKTGGLDIAIRHAEIAASGDRILISLRVAVNEGKSWLGFNSEATIYLWGRPALDRAEQVVRLTDISLDVESEAAFGLLGAGARAAGPYLVSALTDQGAIDLKPYAANARKSAEAMIANFRGGADGFTVEASVNNLRLVNVAYDATTLRVIAEADGTVKVAVNTLPAR